MSGPLAAFHHAVRQWFSEIGEPTEPQRRGWPLIRAGGHVLLAAPTGTGKTLAAFLVAIDSLLQDPPPGPETRVLYISPLKALGNDIEVNLRRPLEGVRHHDVTAPEVRVAVRHGDTDPASRARMLRKPPHILVTTPESLAILLTSESGRAMLRDVRSVIVDEIHALAGSKRGSHLALSLERLSRLTSAHRGREPQRIGLSATQKPLADIASFLFGAQRSGEIVDVGHLRELDLGLETTPSPIEPVCSHDRWAEIVERCAELVTEHRTTLIFVTTRKLAERVAALLRDRLDDPETCTCHHGSLSKERRHDAEQRLKQGRLRALVATASLELGIDIGDVDLVIQLGSSRTIATFLQRAGRAGHGVGRIPKARLVPLTIDELEEHAALLRAVQARDLDAIIQPRQPLDILAQQIVAACAAEPWEPQALFELCRSAWPYRHLTRTSFERVVDLHTGSRRSLLRRDAASGHLRAVKHARTVAITAGGAIPDTADFTVKEEPEGTVVGSLDEDFSLESAPGDVFQLGTTSWQIVRIDGRAGVVHVRHAGDAPPTVPFWFGEAPARSRELSEHVGSLREAADGVAWLQRECLLDAAAAEQLWQHLDGARQALGLLPSQRRVVAERFFDDSGGMQLIIHAPLGARLMRAWGLALRKRFCRGFGFELEATATEDALLLSLSPTTSFKLEEVFDYLSPNSARATLTQACITGGQFEIRWRWNVTRALVVPRSSGGKRVPPYLVRLRAADALAAAFPHVLACPENLGPGGIEIPEDHPLVDQTLDDCLTELMDVDGLEEVLQALRDGTIERHAVDTVEPSPLARVVTAAAPYAFLDDTEFLERRVRATPAAGGTRVEEPGALDPAVVAEVQAQLRPQPESPTDLLDVLGWIGFLEASEAAPWRPWLRTLADQGLVVERDGRWFARETDPDDAIGLLRGRLEADGLVPRTAHPEQALFALEQEGLLIRCRIHGDEREWWAERRILHRIHRLMREGRRRGFEPVSAAALWRFLAHWQHLAPEVRVEGPAGCLHIVEQLAGCEAPATAWLKRILPQRVRDFSPAMLDELTLAGEVAWGRLWNPAGAGSASRREAGGGLRFLPVSFLPADVVDDWLAIAPAANEDPLSGAAREVLAALRARGACFHRELAKLRILPEHLEHALAELVAAGFVSGDALGALRWLALPGDRRAKANAPRGRWHLFRRPPLSDAITADHPPHPDLIDEEQATAVARQLLRRTGVVFRRTWERERLPVPWRKLWRALRRLELAGECLGGRFVSGFSGEQFAVPDAAKILHRFERSTPGAIHVSAADPLNFTGLLTPERRTPTTSGDDIAIA